MEFSETEEGKKIADEIFKYHVAAGSAKALECAIDEGFKAGQESVSIQRIVVDTVNLHKQDWMEKARQDFAEEVKKEIIDEMRFKQGYAWAYRKLELLAKKAGKA